jgi:hypothetical protein
MASFQCVMRIYILNTALTPYKRSHRRRCYPPLSVCVYELAPGLCPLQLGFVRSVPLPCGWGSHAVPDSFAPLASSLGVLCTEDLGVKEEPIHTPQSRLPAAL